MDVFLSAFEREMGRRTQRNKLLSGFGHSLFSPNIKNLSDVGFDVVGGSCETRRKYTWWTEGEQPYDNVWHTIKNKQH